MTILNDLKENCQARAQRNGYPVDSTLWSRFQPFLVALVGIVTLAIISGIIRSILER